MARRPNIGGGAPFPCHPLQLWLRSAPNGCTQQALLPSPLTASPHAQWPLPCHPPQLSLEECTHLETAALRSRRMQRMSLGTCPRLCSIAIDCETMEELVRSGPNSHCLPASFADTGPARLQTAAFDATLTASLAAFSAAGPARLQPAAEPDAGVPLAAGHRCHLLLQPRVRGRRGLLGRTSLLVATKMCCLCCVALVCRPAALLD